MRRALLCACALAAASCQLDDHGTRVFLSVSVQSQGDLSELSFSLWAPDGEVPRSTGTRSVGRTSRELDIDPVVVRLGPLPRARYVLSIVGAGPDGERFVGLRCYTLVASLDDTVLLVPLAAGDDEDGDGFSSDPLAACAEPGPRPCGASDYACDTAVGTDCDDSSPAVFPGAPWQCQNGIDEDCDGADEECGDLDGDGVEACPVGGSLGCDCDDADPRISPRAEDTCGDGIDQDCDGADACCDADGDGYTQCVDPVTSARTGDCIDTPDDCLRQVPPCDPTSIDAPSVNPGAPEVCFDGVDNDCNGMQDEVAACRGPDLDGDGVDVCGMERPGAPCEEARFDCDPGLSPTGRERCYPLGIDDDVDGMIDEGCPPGDADGDGQSAPRDCDDTDPLTYTHDAGDPVIERCGDGVAQSCIPGEDVSCPAPGDTDGDGFVEPPGCEGDASIRPDATDVCNGVDDDCDGVVDEVLDPTMSLGCVGGAPVDFATDLRHCGGCRVDCAEAHGAGADACVGGACVCRSDPSAAACTEGDRPTCCDDGCHDLANDVTSCGGCGLACGAGERCEAGRCVCGAIAASTIGEQACPEPGGGGVESNACCGGACRDVSADVANCGACGAVCGPNALCTDGACACDPAASRDDCNGDLGTDGDGCETDVRTSTTSCGGCGRICAPPRSTGVCSGGACMIASCNPGFSDCNSVAADGCETSLTTLTSCGSCGVTCARTAATATCSTGSCRIQACNAGRADCDGMDGNGCEVALVSLSSCGACGVSCGPGEACSGSGRCTCGSTSGAIGSGRACAGATTCCGSGCVNTSTDANHCGSCGMACRAGETCSGSTCRCDGGPACTGSEVCCPGIGCRPSTC
ncbi:MAG: hypothetical protein H6719_00160 [Sandaracinaceae bacterium]|nr:hypothetical protein [Sandaracinaceae bacterium]